MKGLEVISPCCSDTLSDLDCDKCGGNGTILTETDEDYCPNCDGDGYQYGWYECDSCGDVFHESELEWKEVEE